MTFHGARLDLDPGLISRVGGDCASRVGESAGCRLGRPGSTPGCCWVRGALSDSGGQLPGDGEPAQPQWLGFPASGLVAGQRQQLQPGGDLACQDHDRAVDLVLGGIMQGTIRQAGVFCSVNAVFGSSSRWWRNFSSGAKCQVVGRDHPLCVISGEYNLTSATLGFSDDGRLLTCGFVLGTARICALSGASSLGRWRMCGP